MSKLTGTCECGEWTWNEATGLWLWRGGIGEADCAARKLFCAQCSSRLNADGTADIGSAAWEAFDEAQSYEATRFDLMRSAAAANGLRVMTPEDWLAEQEAQA
jgi:hypothetical protein